MPDVAVVTDTTHYLPRETVAELGVRDTLRLAGWAGP